MHPGNNKQNVSLALNVFDETTVAGILSYFPDESPPTGFLRLIQSWWNISNSKSSINTHNHLGNAVIRGDNKPLFLRAFATWLRNWSSMQLPGCSKFMLSAQTFDALIVTLEGTAALLDDLLEDLEYEFVLTSRFQTDTLERHFGKTRQMSGSRFLISLREFKSSNKILSMMPLLKADIHCWNELTRDVFPERDEFVKKLKSIEKRI